MLKICFQRLCSTSSCPSGIGHRCISSQTPSALEQELKLFFQRTKLPFVEGWTCFRCPNILRHNSLSYSSLKINKTQIRDFDLTCYINKINGNFWCQDTKHEGHWDVYKQIYHLQRSKRIEEAGEVIEHHWLKMSETDEKNISSIWYDECKSISELPNDELPRMFGLDLFPEDVLTNFNVKFRTRSNEVVFPWIQWNPKEGATVRGFKVIHDKNYCHEEIVSVSSKAYTTYPSSNYHSLFGMNPSLNKTSSIVLTANEFDALAINSVSTKHSALCLPDGMSQLPLQVLPLLENFSNIVLWFGTGLLSWEYAECFAKKLGVKRCKLIRSKLPVTTAYQAYKGCLNLDSVIESAVSPVSHQFITFEDFKNDVRHELLNQETFSGVPYRRFDKLNKKLKGHRRGELTVVTGPTGSGKTTLVSELSLDLAVQGVATLWGSFEINNKRLLKCMLKQFARMDLENNMEKFNEVAAEFGKLPLLLMTYQGSHDINAVMETMRQAVYMKDIQHVIIDNLQFLMGTQTKVDRFLLQDSVIAGFRKFATAENVHVTLVIHPRKEDSHLPLQLSSIFGSAKATQEADNVLILQQHKLHNQTTYSKYLEVAKNRYDGDLGNIRLHFNRKTLCMSPPPLEGNNENFASNEVPLRENVECNKVFSSDACIRTTQASDAQLDVALEGENRMKSTEADDANGAGSEKWVRPWL